MTKDEGVGDDNDAETDSMYYFLPRHSTFRLVVRCSWQDFYDKYDAMDRSDLEEISSKMRKANMKTEEDLVAQWRAVLKRVNPPQEH